MRLKKGWVKGIAVQSHLQCFKHTLPILSGSGGADHIVVLKDGRVEAEGRLEELLEGCEEMRRLWKGKVGEM